MASSSRFSRPPEIPCPMCPYTADDPYVIQLHIDAVHDKPEPPSQSNNKSSQIQQRLPPVPPKQPQTRRMVQLPSQEPEPDPYNPFKYQIPNNNSREVVGAPQYSPTTASRGRESNEDGEVEYIPCQWKDCGEHVSLMQLEEHIAMHEEADLVDEGHQDYPEEFDQKDIVLDKKERKGEALMEAASNKRQPPKKEGPSNRQPKKMGQMERRLESEAMAKEREKTVVEDDSFDDDDEDYDFRKDQHSNKSNSDKAAHSDDEMTKEYDIIDKDEIPENLDEKSKESKPKKSKSEKSSKHSESKKSKQGYGGYASSEPLQAPKRNALQQSLKKHKPRFKKSELGPYANEKKMPEWLRDALAVGGKEVLTKTIGSDGGIVLRRSYHNETSGLVPVIRQLLTLDPNVSKAYVCHPSVKHVFKEHMGANGFCGYRNIQMMTSYCQKVQVQGCERLYGARIPTVPQIQEWIEHAWDMGINEHARKETGGILNTRKYIGSSEVEAMFTSFGATTVPQQFSEPNQQIEALRFVWEYFSNEFDQSDKVVQTDKPPVYFQHYGHSMTIVGIERYKDGTMCLICFDPMFTPSQAIRGLVGQSRLRPNIAYGKLLKPFRKGGHYLKRYSMFEMVELVPQPDLSLSIYE